MNQPTDKEAVYQQIERLCQNISECDKRMKSLLNASRELTHRWNLVNDERVMEIYAKYRIED